MDTKTDQNRARSVQYAWTAFIKELSASGINQSNLYPNSLQSPGSPEKKRGTPTECWKHRRVVGGRALRGGIATPTSCTTKLLEYGTGGRSSAVCVPLLTQKWRRARAPFLSPPETIDRCTPSRRGGRTRAARQANAKRQQGANVER